ncbi:transcription termination factor Rho [Ferrimicrobium sp.]|uniref:transcription termination factor Rho n=1 Tax=Ferrimicrobium sp. TaxID=2926050 RepID=UPI00262F571C|nr:transcription termination factor Rho [Ferrimicrobium sp.]
MDVSSGTLESLDKEALIGLARQLDLKVSSRLRKADLISMIESRGSGDGERRTATERPSVGSLGQEQERPNTNGSGTAGSNTNGSGTAGSNTNGSAPGSAHHREATQVRGNDDGRALNGTGESKRGEGTRGGLATLIPPITVNPTERTNVPQVDEPQAPSSARGEDGTSRRSRRNRRGKDRTDRPENAERSENQQTIELVTVSGVLDLRDDGYGFLRTKGYLSSKEDVYVPAALARRMSLRRGDIVVGGARPAGSTEKYPALSRVDTVTGLDPETAKARRRFEDLTPLFPNERLTLETSADPTNITPRIIDLIAPIGKGQRGLIVSPPKAGKTTIMKEIANAIERNNPDVALIVLLVDERPEEVTDFRRSVKGEVIASTFDRPAEEHTQVAELTIERAKRMVEMGRDVVVILDGITRLARAYNLAQPASGRIMSGGIDSGALYPPKKFFGAARNIEEGGSLTILATALVENGSKMDEVIFEEVKGTGNMELKLDRRLSERRLYPAVDVNGSSTRHEELLFSRDHLNQIWKLRRVLNAITQDGTAAAGLELLLDKVRSTRSNSEFLAEIARSSGMQ